MTTIGRLTTRDLRHWLTDGHGADAIHRDPTYAYAAALLESDAGHVGTGLAFTLGAGNENVCALIRQLGEALVGREIEELMADSAGCIAAWPITHSCAGLVRTRGPSIWPLPASRMRLRSLG